MSYPILEKNKQIVLDWNKGNFTKAVEQAKAQMSDILFINEVFETIQCEWKSMWMPVVFIRTYGCNLKCWFANPDGTKGCDTPYTWKLSATEESDKNKYTPEMLVEEILQYPSHWHWVVTWGEPLLQGKKFIKVFEEYKKRTGSYPYVEFETNGTVIPSDELDTYVWHYNVSLKLENSNATESTGYTKEDEEYNWNTKERRVKSDAVKYFTNSNKSYFKFVVDRNLSSLPEIKELQKEYSIPNSKVWVMPEWNSPDDINKASLPLIEVCKKEGYRFSTRLHILVWWFLRGV